MHVIVDSKVVEELPPQKKGGDSSSGKDPERLRRFPEKQNVCLDPLLKEWDCGKQPVHFGVFGWGSVSFFGVHMRLPGHKFARIKEPVEPSVHIE